MKIAKVITDVTFPAQDAQIIFDNGNVITYRHDRDCCEYNYMDVESIPNDVYINEDFDPDLTFEHVEGMGFTFGNPGKKIFVPCYSEQNGYYTDQITILYNGEEVLSVNCKEVID